MDSCPTYLPAHAILIRLSTRSGALLNPNLALGRTPFAGRAPMSGWCTFSPESVHQPTCRHSVATRALRQACFDADGTDLPEDPSDGTRMHLIHHDRYLRLLPRHWHCGAGLRCRLRAEPNHCPRLDDCRRNARHTTASAVDGVSNGAITISVISSFPNHNRFPPQWSENVAQTSNDRFAGEVR